MSPVSGEQLLATILKHDNKSTSYKIALLRAINDVVLLHPEVARQGQAVAVPLTRLAELWIAYYWPFADDLVPIYQGGRATRGVGIVVNDIAFRPALTALRLAWQQLVQLPRPARRWLLLAYGDADPASASYLYAGPTTSVSAGRCCCSQDNSNAH